MKILRLPKAPNKDFGDFGALERGGVDGFFFPTLPHI
jgi:hypothetical protein